MIIKHKAICLEKFIYKFVYGKYAYGDFYYDNVSTHRILPVGYRIDPKTVCVFTGIYDSTEFNELSELEAKEWLSIEGNSIDNWRGKEIYENDIFIYESDYKIDISNLIRKDILNILMNVNG